MRIGTRSFFDQMSATVTRLQTQLGDLNVSMSSGKRVSKPSDDPLDAVLVAQVNTELSTAKTRAEVLSGGVAMLREADGALSQISDALQGAIQSASTSLQATSQGQSQLAACAVEIRSYAQSILTAANTKSGDRYLFGGYQDRQTPFVGGALSTTYAGDSNQMTVPLGNGRTCPIAVPGDQVLNYKNSSGTRAVDAVDADVFTALESLACAVETGDSGAVRQRLDDMQALRSNVVQLRGAVGSWDVRLQASQDALEDARLRYQEILADRESIDLAAGVTEYAAQETAYKATLSVLGQILQLPTLFDLTG
ncbi:hypothetical protein LLH03_19545 [bacterium]|nr:hypothetical protein [bacterium]